MRKQFHHGTARATDRYPEIGAADGTTYNQPMPHNRRSDTFTNATDRLNRFNRPVAEALPSMRGIPPRCRDRITTAQNNGGLRFARPTMPCFLYLVAFILLAGCSRRDFVSITNESETALLVQLALPWPTYSIAIGGDVHFEFHLPPGATWNTSHASAKDAVELRIKPNGVTVLRIWPKNANPRWIVFNGNTGEWADLRIQSEDGEFTVKGHNHEGRVFLLNETTFDWFGE